MPKRSKPLEVQPVSYDKLIVDLKTLKTEILFLKGYAENRHVFQGTAVDDVCKRCLEGIAGMEADLEHLKLKGPA